MISDGLPMICYFVFLLCLSPQTTYIAIWFLILIVALDIALYVIHPVVLKEVCKGKILGISLPQKLVAEYKKSANKAEA